MRTQQKFFGRFVKHVKPGSLSWIGLRPAQRAAMLEVDTVMALTGLGLEGDHRCQKTVGSARQVTLISEEYIQQIAHFTGRKRLDPSLLRRNLVVRNLNLSALRHQQFTIGDTLLEATALCHPCSRMEQVLGKGGVAAMLGHGGLCAKIINGGRIHVGDAVTVVSPQGDLF